MKNVAAIPFEDHAIDALQKGAEKVLNAAPNKKKAVRGNAGKKAGAAKPKKVNKKAVQGGRVKKTS